MHTPWGKQTSLTNPWASNPSYYILFHIPQYTHEFTLLKEIFTEEMWIRSIPISSTLDGSSGSFFWTTSGSSSSTSPNSFHSSLLIPARVQLFAYRVVDFLTICNIRATTKSLHWKTGFEANNKEAWTDPSSNHSLSSTKNLWLLRTACNAITRRKNTDVGPRSKYNRNWCKLKINHSLSITGGLETRRTVSKPIPRRNLWEWASDRAWA